MTDGDVSTTCPKCGADAATVGLGGGVDCAACEHRARVVRWVDMSDRYDADGMWVGDSL